MSRLKKLQGLISQSNAEQDASIYVSYLYNERAKKKKARKQERAKKRQNRNKK